MSALHFALAGSILVAIGHSVLSEKLHLRPLRRSARTRGTEDETWIRLSTLMYHFPSLLWIVLAIALMQLGPSATGTPQILIRC